MLSPVELRSRYCYRADKLLLKLLAEFWIETLEKGIKDMIASSIDLKSQLIAEEIENILENYPEELSQESLEVSEFRTKLTAYVLNRLKHAKNSRDEREDRLKPLKTKFPYHSLELRLAVEQYIIEGITSFLGVNLKPLEQDDFPEKSFLVLSAIY